MKPPLYSLMDHSEKSQLPCHEDTQAVLQRFVWWSIVTRQQGTEALCQQSREWATLEKILQTQPSLQMTSPGWNLDWNTLSLNHSAKSLSNSWPTATVNLCSFQTYWHKVIHYILSWLKKSLLYLYCFLSCFRWFSWCVCVCVCVCVLFLVFSFLDCYW